MRDKGCAGAPARCSLPAPAASSQAACVLALAPVLALALALALFSACSQAARVPALALVLLAAVGERSIRHALSWAPPASTCSRSVATAWLRPTVPPVPAPTPRVSPLSPCPPSEGSPPPVLNAGAECTGALRLLPPETHIMRPPGGAGAPSSVTLLSESCSLGSSPAWCRWGRGRALTAVSALWPSWPLRSCPAGWGSDSGGSPRKRSASALWNEKLRRCSPPSEAAPGLASHPPRALSARAAVEARTASPLPVLLPPGLTPWPCMLPRGTAPSQEDLRDSSSGLTMWKAGDAMFCCRWCCSWRWG